MKYSDTTVKLESSLVREAAGVMAEKQTLTAYVREAVLRDIRRRKLKKSALQYQDALNQCPKEAGEMKDWEAASLLVPPRRKAGRP